MRIVQTTKRFRKDYAKLKKSGNKNFEKLHKVMDDLIEERPLAAIHKDHPLRGEWSDFRDCHVESDWVLIYKLTKTIHGENVVTFCAMDNHSNLFD